MTPQLKTCFKCGKEKPIEEFYIHRAMKDGHLNKCKDCTKQDTRENRIKNIVYYKIYDRKRSSLPHRIEARKLYAATEEYKEKHKILLKKYREANKYKKNARERLRNAIITGKITIKPCEICGETRNVQAHHEDYSKPLDVIWLCTKHHAWIHK